MAGEKRPRRPVVFGEVLFDVFPDGREILGGAPLNLAWHLAVLGADPLLISRVGDDPRGRRALDRMGAWKMDVSGVQIDRERPTGTVRVTFAAGEPRYEITPDVAWDAIDPVAACEAFDAVGGRDPSILVHGTLACRAPGSAEALDALRVDGVPVFVDVNLRNPFWSEEIVQEALADARWAKLNEHELHALFPAPAWDDEAGAALCGAYGLDAAIVTRGAAGARICEPSSAVVSAGPPAGVEVADTVGAGDGFSAVCVLGILRGWDWETILDRALDFAGAVCGVRGATPVERAFYDRFRAAWRLV